MKSVIYEDYAVCFLDILGFKELLKDLNSLTRIVEIIEDVNDFAKPRGFEISSDWQIQHLQISDGILIWCKVPSSSHVVIFLNKILMMVGALNCIGVPVRGCISYGKHFYRNGVLVSPVFVEAYTLESKKAKYPRVILSETALIEFKRLNDLSKNNRAKLLNLWIKKDLDGLYYINHFLVLNKAPDKYRGDESLKMRIRMIKHFKKTICDGLQNKDKAIIEKYEWLKEKYNKYIKAQKIFEQLTLQNLLIT